jgi:hypothetical protein
MTDVETVAILKSPNGTTLPPPGTTGGVCCAHARETLARNLPRSVRARGTVDSGRVDEQLSSRSSCIATHGNRVLGKRTLLIVTPSIYASDMSDLDPDRFTPRQADQARDDRRSVTLDLHYSVASAVIFAVVVLITALELVFAR